MIRAIIRRILLWACPDLYRYEAMSSSVVSLRMGHARTVVDASLMASNMREWQRFAAELGACVVSLRKEVDMLRVREASGATYRGLDVRLARIECMIMPPISDMNLEVDAQLEAALKAVGNVKGGAA